MEFGATPDGSGVRHTLGNRIEPHFLIRVSLGNRSGSRRTRASRQVTSRKIRSPEIAYGWMRTYLFDIQILIWIIQILIRYPDTYLDIQIPICISRYVSGYRCHCLIYYSLRALWTSTTTSDFCIPIKKLNARFLVSGQIYKIEFMVTLGFLCWQIEP